jgi:hypothetical protein
MKLLNRIKRLMAFDDSTAGIQNVVLVACICILCLSIKINAHRNSQAASRLSPDRSPIHKPADSRTLAEISAPSVICIC